MFVHHSMTDREILRVVQGCESAVTRLVADRLDSVLQRMAEVHQMAQATRGASPEDQDKIATIESLSKAQ